MPTLLKVIFITSLAALTLGGAVATASAGRFSISNQTFRAVWTRMTFGISSFNMSCPITLEGTFHYRSILKVLRRLIGYVTRAAVGHSCRTSIGTAAEAWAWNGVERILNEITTTSVLPLHVTYEGFGGVLPTISRINFLLTGFKLTIAAPLSGCLATYGGPSSNTLGEASVSSGTVTELRPEPNTFHAITESAAP